MARRARVEYPGALYHVITRGNQRQRIFRDDRDREKYLEILSSLKNQFSFRIPAYVLMPNHVHLLLTPGDDPRSISVLMQRVARHATRRWNLRRDTAGSLWEARFKSRLVDSERYLLECCRYIELNPVRAGLTKSAADYRWSSYQARMGLVSDENLDLHERYLAMGPDHATRRKEYGKWCLIRDDG